MSSTERTAVFWDLGNCLPPSLLTGFELVHLIRRAILPRYGRITHFKVYTENPEDCPSRLTSELAMSGVEVVDCADRSRQASVPSIITADMFAYALDNPAPATLILISGSMQFVYPVSLLSNRNYEVVLIAPSRDLGPMNVGMTVHASLALDWRHDVLGIFDGGDFDATHKRQSYEGSPHSSGEPEERDSLTHLNQPAGFTQRHDDGGINLSGSSSTTRGARRRAETRAPRTDRSESERPNAEMRFQYGPAGISTRWNGTRSDVKDLPSPPPPPRASLENRMVDEPKSYPHSRAHELGKERNGAYRDFYDALMDSKPAHGAHPETAHPRSHMPSPPHDTPGKPDGVSSHNNHTSPFRPSVHIASPVSQAGLSPYPEPPRAASSASSYRATDKHVDFQPLIDRLRTLELSGSSRPLRSLVGVTLKSVYRQAGVAGLGQYITMGEKLGLVEAGGIGGSAWVALSANWQENLRALHGN